MNKRQFPYEKFLKYKEIRDQELMRLHRGELNYVPVMQTPPSNFFGSICNTKEGTLESQLEYLARYTELKSDIAMTYLEPWHGVGLYAAAFGCKYEWSEHTSPQTRAIYETIDEVENLKYPSMKDCEIMNFILDSIRYFREQTGDQLDITITDTQSPNDNASLILDSCEFFVGTITEMERLERFMNQITDLTIEFTEKQFEAIGPCLARPGHIMYSSREMPGISISDDNMAVISPASYEASALPYNNRLSEHFGGLSIHTCGNFAATAPLVKQTKDLIVFDCALDLAADPNPNSASVVRETFRGTDTIVKTRLLHTNVELLRDLLYPDVKLAVHIFTGGTNDEMNRQWYAAKEKIDKMYAENSKK